MITLLFLIQIFELMSLKINLAFSSFRFRIFLAIKFTSEITLIEIFFFHYWEALYQLISKNALIAISYILENLLFLINCVFFRVNLKILLSNYHLTIFKLRLIGFLEGVYNFWSKLSQIRIRHKIIGTSPCFSWLFNKILIAIASNTKSENFISTVFAFLLNQADYFFW